MPNDPPKPLARVVLAELSALMGHMVGEALRERGVEVDVITDHRKLLTERDPAVVIVPTPEICRALLKGNPRLRVLTLTAAAQSTDLYELRRLGQNVDEKAVVSAVRDAAIGLADPGAAS